ncbi:MAG TPA: FAD-dependent oxidoreductase, partial [Xanthomonadaceae bacterium]|nr:FAD-dependent oxidoreductase [Xanthomonadaceae bacterium]
SVVIATGVTPRAPRLEGSERPNVVSYIDALEQRRPVGRRVAIIGAGGIGFDVAEFLVQPAPSPTTDIGRWLEEWGIDRNMAARGAVEGVEPKPEPPEREVYLLQRSKGRPGARLNKTSGWVHRATLRAKGVQMIGGVDYQRIDDEGLHVVIDGQPRMLAVDTVVICAGQEPNRALADALTSNGIQPVLIGGAEVASELDAKRAIARGTEVACSL